LWNENILTPATKYFTHKSYFKIETSAFDPKFPVEFTEDEISDGWVRIRPSYLSSAFHISFSDQTPKRLFESPLTSDSLAIRRKSNIKAKKE
jgi:hypothetical protein